MKLKLKVDGMTCGHCIAAVDKAVHSLDGVKDAHVEIGSVELTYDPARLDAQRIIHVIEEEGYRAEAA